MFKFANGDMESHPHFPCKNGVGFSFGQFYWSSNTHSEALVHDT